MAATVTVTVTQVNYQSLKPWAVTQLVPITVVDDLIKLVPPNYRLPPWAVVSTTEFDAEITSTGTEEGYAYIDVPNVTPIDGAVDIPIDTSPFIPAGDVIIPPQRTVTIAAMTGQPSRPVTGGLYDPSTVIRHRRMGSGWTTVYANGMAQNGWAVTSTINGIYGFDYLLTPPEPFPNGSNNYVEISVIDFLGHTASYTYHFLTPTGSIIEQVLSVAKDVIMVVFSTNVVADDQVKNQLNYELVNLSGGTTPVLKQVLAAYGRTATLLFLQLKQMEWGQRYQITIKRAYDSAGNLTANMVAEWVHHRTKVDAAIESLASMWDTKGRSTIRSILEAVMISDEKIGGDY